MAWASVGRAGSTGNTGNNQSSIVITLNGQAGEGAAVSDVLVGAFSVDNASSVNNADNGDITSVVDSSSNTWIKVREITAGGGAAQAGVTCALWYTHVDNALTTSNTVTATFNVNTASDASAGIVWRFTNGAGAVRVIDSTHVVIATSSCGNLSLTAPNATQYLRFRAVGAESTVTAFTTTAGWTTIGTTRSGTAVGAEVAIFGEFLISSSATEASNPSISAAADNASIYGVFENCELMGDQAIS